jgi:hypothetical protein
MVIDTVRLNSFGIGFGFLERLPIAYFECII